MNERIFIPQNAEGLAIPSQTVYSERWSSNSMADEALPDKPKAKPSANAPPAKGPDAAKGAQELNVQATSAVGASEEAAVVNAMREAKKQGVNEDPVEMLRRISKEARKKNGEKKDGRESEAPRRTINLSEIPRGDPVMAQVAKELESAIGNGSIEKVGEKTLLIFYVRLRKRAEELEIAPTFLSDLVSELKDNRGIDPEPFYELYKHADAQTQSKAEEVVREEEQKAEKERDLRAAWKKWEKEEKKELDREDKEKLIRKGLRPISGGAVGTNKVEFPSLTPTGNPALDHIVDELNSIPGDQRERRADIRFIEEKQNLIDDYVLRNPGASDMAQNLWQQLEVWRQSAEILREEAYRREREQRIGLYRERELTDAEKVLIDEDINTATGNNRIEGKNIDRLYNRIYEEADARATEEFGQHAFGPRGEFERHIFFDHLRKLREDADQNKVDTIQKFLHKYDTEHRMRELLHNAYHIAETEGEFKDFAGFCTRFASHLADQAFLDAPEVEAALHTRENVLYQIKREHKGYIPPERVMYDPARKGSEWEDKTLEQLREMNNRGIFSDDSKPLEEWKINRAMSISRGMGMVLLRFPEIIAETHLAAPSSLYQSQPSVPWEKLVWELNAMDYKLKRYEMGYGLRALMYAAKERTVGRMKIGIGPWKIETRMPQVKLWNQNELRDALALDAISVFSHIGRDKRMADMRNFFQTGGPLTHTMWRPYAAALEENRDRLRPLLETSPGLTMHMGFNKYENKDQNKRRYEFFKKYRAGDHSEEEILEQWERAKKDFADKDRDIWKENEVKSWLSSTRKIPHVILRVLTDKSEDLLSEDKSRELLQKIAPGEKYEGKWYTDAEKGLSIAKENLMKRRKAAKTEAERKKVPVESVWIDQLDRLLPEDFEQIKDPAQYENAKKLHEEMVKFMTEEAKSKGEGGIYKKILDKVENRLGFAYAITSEDIPWGEFAYGQTGPRGFFTRKINDALSVSEANEALVELIKYTIPHSRTPEELIAQLIKIYKPLEIYGKDFAQDAVADISIGLIRLYEQDGELKMPIWGFIKRPINMMIHRGNSYAQSIYGGKAMDWDSDDIYNFTEQLRAVLYDERGFKKIQAIRKETGGTFWHAFGQRTGIMLQLLLAILSFEFASRLVKEK